MPLQPAYPPFTTRPTTRGRKSAWIQNHALLRDQFTVPTWLLIGAFIQGILTLLLPYRTILLILPIFLILMTKLATALLATFAIIPNPTKSDVLPYRTALAYPDQPGTFVPDAPGTSPICAILLAVVSHHPLGMLAPGYKQVGRAFDAMLDELDGAATTHGFLGATAWMSTERTAANEVAGMLYFAHEDALHAYAHGPLHSRFMAWWAEAARAGMTKDVGIMHEVFACRERSWEGVYVNYHPTGLAATTKEVRGEDGTRMWVSPVVKARGRLLYSKGRMGRDFGKKEWTQFDEALTADEKEGLAY